MRERLAAPSHPGACRHATHARCARVRRMCSFPSHGRATRSAKAITCYSVWADAVLKNPICTGHRLPSERRGDTRGERSAVWYRSTRTVSYI